jgi:hypothetical protein
MTPEQFNMLSAPFPRDAVHWRAQTLTKAGDKALALAYIDARDVMDRLDDVCGPANWQSEYFETPKGRLVCRLSIRCGDEWVTKSDGAGDTAVEGEKGAISDALKRAAVSWGIGRYLYRMASVWVPCEIAEYNGKKTWRAWKDDPWKFVRSAQPEPQAQHRQSQQPKTPPTAIDNAIGYLAGADDIDDLRRIWGNLPKDVQAVQAVIDAKDARKAALDSNQAEGKAQ